MLSVVKYPDFPVSMGIFRQVETSTYEEKVAQQINAQVEKKVVGDLAKLLRVDQVWTY